MLPAHAGGCVVPTVPVPRRRLRPVPSNARTRGWLRLRSDRTGHFTTDTDAMRARVIPHGHHAAMGASSRSGPCPDPQRLTPPPARPSVEEGDTSVAG